MTLLAPPLIAFACAALLGLVLAAHVLRGRFAPWALSPIHALLGAIGLCLMLTPLNGGAAPVWIGFGLLFVAASLGFVLVSFHVREQLPPKWLVLAHASCAVSGFGLLLYMALGR